MKNYEPTPLIVSISLSVCSRSALFLVAVLIVFTNTASAQQRGISLIRDAEIEALVRDYARPLMKAAGLRRGSIEYFIVNDNSFNAFVNGRGMFINTGLLLQAKNPNEVIGVMAHEIGHIVGGHQIRLSERVDSARRIARVATLLGVGVSAAGAVTRNNQLGAAGFGIAGGGQNIAVRGVLAYQRDEERAADRYGVNLLKKTKQSGAGMLSTFKNLADQQSIISGRIDPYLQSHPVPAERIRALTSLVQKSPYYKQKDSTSLRQRHDMIRAKIAAYIGGNRYARSLLAGKDLHPTARLYGRAIVSHLYGSPKKALPLIDKLIKQSPKNAYLHEMKGEILLRSGKAKQAAGPFGRAVKLDRYNAGFLRVQYGHALLDSGGKANAKKAIVQLKKGLASDPTAVTGYQFLARAYGEVGRVPEALLASAELARRTGKKGQAKNYARRAQKGLKRGSPGWLRAQDIIEYK